MVTENEIRKAELAVVMPLATPIAHLVGIEGASVLVRGLDCLDGTPLLDLKPDRTLLTPIAPPRRGDFRIGDP